MTPTTLSEQSPAIPKVLLVEDDTALAAAMQEYLEKQGFSVESESRGDRVLEHVTGWVPDVVVLDVMLPGKDGFEVCRELRSNGHRFPVMILTAREDDIDQVLGLELGADDYLTKPVQPRVLLARVKAALRRATPGAKAEVGEVLQFGRLRIDGTNREVTLATERIVLTPAEFDLLWILASNAGHVMLRSDLLKQLRGLHYGGADRSVDARLYRLRRRFSDHEQASWKIKTVRPHGYMFCVEPW
jgi:DNA-binding response OmpR family regulator